MTNRHCVTCLDLLYFEDCPSYRRVWQDLAEVILETDADACVRLVRVETLEQAAALRFPGSPTVRVNGRDVEGHEGPEAMACRMYAENGGRSWPSRRLLHQALLAAKG